MSTFTKDPEAVLDYTIDWSSWLDSDTISSSDWTVSDGLTESSSTNDTTSATIWLSGGSVGRTYRVTNTIITVGGRTEERSFLISMADR